MTVKVTAEVPADEAEGFTLQRVDSEGVEIESVTAEPGETVSVEVDAAAGEGVNGFGDSEEETGGEG